MYRADQMTIESGVPSIVLMENAALAVVEEIQSQYAPKKVTVFCGPGNNGGDGFAIARLLEEMGIATNVLFFGDFKRTSNDCAINLNRWHKKIFPCVIESIHDADLFVDAIFGAGLSKDLAPELQKFISFINQLDTPVLSVDVPSGIDANTGEIRGICFKADSCVSFFRPKPAHFLLPSKKMCGTIIIKDIGINKAVLEDIKPTNQLNKPAHLFPFPELETHKFQRGHGVIITGDTMTGASRLAAITARRVGLGLLTLQTEKTAALIYRLSEPGHIVSTDTVKYHLKDSRKNAYLIGPGLGINDKNKKKLQLLIKSDVKKVIDADALILLSELKTFPHLENTILTPHEGEFRKIFPDIHGPRIFRAKKAAKKSNSVLILKGSDTLIAHPDGRCVVNNTGTPWLATAGSGDSLAGICLGLLGQGLSPFDAACLGVWLHGRCAEEIGEGLISEDISHFLPLVIKKIKKMNSSC